MPNMGRILKSHNRSVLSKQSNNGNIPERSCNCRNQDTCPLKGQCQVPSVVYQADVTSSTGKKYSYIGLTENQFKKRWYGHSQSFNNSKYRLSTELSKLTWELKESGIEYKIDWKIITRSNTYSAGARYCNLCLTEKLHILKNFKNPTSINKRSELISKCRHARKFLIQNSC